MREVHNPLRATDSARVALALSLYTALGGLTSFIGWAADLPRLADWDNNGISIQPNARDCGRRRGSGAPRVHAGATVGIGRARRASTGHRRATLFQWVSGISLWTDTCSSGTGTRHHRWDHRKRKSHRHWHCKRRVHIDPL